jgi:hypothetical protein
MAPVRSGHLGAVLHRVSGGWVSPRGLRRQAGGSVKPRKFSWRGRLRFNRPLLPREVGVLPERPCIRVSCEAADKIRLIANRRGIAKKYVLDLLLRDLLQAGKVRP